MCGNLPYHEKASNKKRLTRRVCFGSVAIAGGAALLITSLPAFADDHDEPKPATADCEIEWLPGSSDTDEGWISAMDESGTQLGGWTYGEAGKLPVVWQDKEIVDVTFESFDEDLTEGTVRAINADGTAVGQAYFTETKGQPFVFQEGEGVLLSTDEYNGGYANGINDDGTIVGYLKAKDDEMPVIWESPDAEPTPLTLPDGADTGRAHDINQDGRVVGGVQGEDNGNATPYQWDAEGNGEEIPGTEPSDIIRATSISGDWIAGQHHSGSGITAVRWGPDDTEPEKFEMLYGVSVNSQGDAVGDWGTNIERRGAVYSAEGEITVLPYPGATTESNALAISDDGSTIAGWIVDEEAEGDRSGYRPTIWNCG